MRIFSALYPTVMRWAAHPRARYYLMGLSFAEASFFPIPPDVMLMPMALAKRTKAWLYAFLAMVFSTLGGVFGYLIGMFFLIVAMPLIHRFGYYVTFVEVQTWFHHWGFWALIIAGFTPIPYKVFTIAAGAVHMLILPFILASLIGRGGRFFLVAGLMYWGGEKLEAKLRQYIDWIGWGTVVLVVILYWYLR